MNRKTVPVRFTVVVKGMLTELYTLTRYVTPQEYRENDVSYQAAIISKNGFSYVFEDGTTIWIPSHHIDRIVWKLS